MCMRVCRLLKIFRAFARLDAALLCFAKAKKGRFHNYLRRAEQGQQHSQPEGVARAAAMDSACEAAADGRLSQCRRLDDSFIASSINDCDDTSTGAQGAQRVECSSHATEGSLCVVLSFTGRLLSAEQVCRTATVLIGCGSGALPCEFVARSLQREVVCFIPAAPRALLYWAGGGFTMYVCPIPYLRYGPL